MESQVQDAKIRCFGCNWSFNSDNRPMYMSRDRSMRIAARIHTKETGHNEFEIVMKVRTNARP